MNLRFDNQKVDGRNCERNDMTDLNMETEAFDKYFTRLTQRKREILMKYITAEETAYRNLRKVLIDAMEDSIGEDIDEYGY